jgi:hypothetical protein
MGHHLFFVEAGCGSQMVDHHHSGVERKGIMNRIGHGPAILSMTESYAVVHNVKHGVVRHHQATAPRRIILFFLRYPGYGL